MISLTLSLCSLVRDITQPLAIKTISHPQPLSNLFIYTRIHACLHTYVHKHVVKTNLLTRGVLPIILVAKLTVANIELLQSHVT